MTPLTIVLWSIATVAYLYCGVRLYLVLKRDSVTPLKAPAAFCVLFLPVCFIGLLILGSMALRWHHWFAKVDPRRFLDFVAMARTKNTKHIDQINHLRRTVVRLRKELDESHTEAKRIGRATANKVLNHAWLEAVGAGRDAMAEVFMERLKATDIAEDDE